MFRKYLLSSVARAPEGEGTGADAAPAVVETEAPENFEANNTIQQDTETGANTTEAEATAAPTEPVVEATETEPTPETGSAPKWVMPRIDKLTRDVRAREARIAELEQRLSAQPAAPATPEAPRADAPRTYTGAELAAEAARLASQTQFNSDCAKMYDAGVKEFPDFGQAVQVLRDGIGAMSTEFLEAALEIGDGHKIIHALARNPDRAASIAALSPIRQATALAKFAGELQAAPRVSAAPAPIVPKVRGSGATQISLDNPNISTADWMKIREKSLRNGEART